MVRTPVRAPHEKAEETQVLGRKRSQLDAASWVLCAFCFRAGLPRPNPGPAKEAVAEPGLAAL